MVAATLLGQFQQVQRPAATSTGLEGIQRMFGGQSLPEARDHSAAKAVR
jgi:hypothetical protein